VGGPWRPLLLSLHRLIRTSRKFTRPAADAAARIAVAFAARNIAASVAAARNDARCLGLSTWVCLPGSVYLCLSTCVCLPGSVYPGRSPLPLPRCWKSRRWACCAQGYRLDWLSSLLMTRGGSRQCLFAAQLRNDAAPHRLPAGLGNCRRSC